MGLRLLFKRDKAGPEDEAAGELVRLRNQRDTVMNHQLGPGSSEEQARNLVRTAQDLQEAEDIIDQKRLELEQFKEVIATNKSGHMCGGCIGCLLGIVLGFAFASIIIN